MANLPEKFNPALKIISEKLNDFQYCIRGTTSLILQGIEMGVDDIDIICDKKTALDSNDLFENYLTEKIEYKESPKYKSYYGKGKIEDISFEIYGEWQIKEKNGSWSKVFDGSDFREISYKGGVADATLAAGVKLKVSTIESELSMFISMGRWNAFHKLKVQLPKEDKAGLDIQKGLFA